MINNNEFFLDRIISIHASSGVVHLKVSTLCPQEGYIDIEVNARDWFFKDIPSLHYFCKKAIKEEDKNIKEKYKQFKKQL